MGKKSERIKVSDQN